MAHIDWAAVYERYRLAVDSASEALGAAQDEVAGAVLVDVLIVYCVHGHEVSRITAMRLRAADLKARYLRGGIEGWQAAGRPLADKAAG